MEITKSEIQWELVILLNELIDYINSTDLIELSLLSKLLRLKLTPFIFNSIEFNNQNLSKNSNYFAKYEVKWQAENKSLFKRIGIYSKRLFDRDTKFKTSIIESFVNEIQVDLDAYRGYVKDLKFVNVEKPCLYIFSITETFTSLTKLNLFDIYVSIANFIQVMKALEDLKELKLTHVTFVKSSESVSASQITFPQSLIEFYNKGCDAIESDLPLSPYEFLFNDKLEPAQYRMEFKPHHLSSLKILSLKSINRPSSYINQWLNLNHQLIDIRFNFGNLDEINFELIAEINTLNSLEFEFIKQEYSDTTLNIPILNSIQSLKILRITTQHSIINQLALSCPNLTKLELECFNYSNEFITNLESSLQNLKTLTLKLEFITSSKFSIPKLSHIIQLNIIFSCNLIEEFILPPVMNIRLISILLIYQIVNIEEVREIHKFYTDWKVKQKFNYILFTPN